MYRTYYVNGEIRIVLCPEKSPVCNYHKLYPDD